MVIGKWYRGLRTIKADLQHARNLDVPMSLESVENLHESLLAMEPSEFVSRFLFEAIPHAFDEDLDLLISWKTRLAAHLHVDPYEMVITGSGAIGFSLNPKKNYRAYHSGSDIDVGVVSLHHFEVAWRYLRKSRPSWLSLKAKTRRALSSHRRNYVFEGAIATDLILPLLPFGMDWQAGLDDMANHPPTIGRDVKLRIYRDYDALRAYQANNIRNLRAEILQTDEPIEIISREED